MGPTSSAFPDTIEIVPDGKIICILGARMGNAPSLDETWTQVLGAVNVDLATWRKVHSTLKGRRPGLECLRRRPHAIPSQGTDLNTPHFTKTRGGGQLMDLPTRTKVIEATWLRPYLDFTAARSIWAWVADIIFAAHISVPAGHLEQPVTINTFFQNWDVALTPALPQDL
ncbi:hypothetical protein EIP86_011094 [Pleurotus ostreatoroseus]|nr:hypothetical protein EIP86_011094 [Pleurotus ostreatoroseus]